jgi:hypothetical protein
MGRWGPGRVSVNWTADTRTRSAKIDADIETAWQQASHRPGVKLFDGPMCRLESFTTGEKLQLTFSRTSYKIFLGTNLTQHPLDNKSLANPVGVSSALQTRDGFLLLGRRNATVAYYPLRVHPFAGALEPDDNLDVFAEVHRELAEELRFSPADFSEVVCLGIAEDVGIRQPELIFLVRTPRTRAQVDQSLDAAEHSASLAIEVDPAEIQTAVLDPVLTPIAAATLLLWGRDRFGQSWFDAAARPVTLPQQ